MAAGRKALRAAPYERVSTLAGGSKARSIDEQNEANAKAIAEHGWIAAGRYQDPGRSASRFARRDREEYDRLTADLGRGAFDVLVLWEPSRGGRNLTIWSGLLDKCRERGVKVYVTSHDHLYDLSVGRDWHQLAGEGVSSAWETEQTSERVRRALDSNAREGRPHGRCPFGYEQDGMTLRPGEASAVISGYALLLTGASLAEIARQWTAGGFTAQAAWKHGGMSPWRPDAVRCVLLSPRYAGLRRYRPGEGPEEIFPARWPAIVPEETWREASGILLDPSRRHIPRGGPRLLSGLALCGVCGATVRAGGAVRHYPMYRCGGSYGHIGRKAEPIEDHVGDVMAEWLARPNVLDHAAGTPADTAGLRLERATLESRLDTIAAQFADGELTAGQIRVITSRIRGRLAGIDTAIAAAGKVSVLAPVLAAEDKRAVWEGATRSQQREIIAALMVIHIDPAGRGTRTFRPETVRIEPKSPVG